MDIAKAIESLRPGAEWVLVDDELTWKDSVQTRPTDEEIATEATRLHSEWLSKEYQRKRAPEYPSITEQLDALFHAGVFPDDMASKIQAVKDKYPKPS